MPPFPGIPYGEAPPWCFPVFECTVYLLFLFCLAYALRQGKRDVIYLLGGLAFGLLLEYVEVLSGSYTYGRFMVMFGQAPLYIPLCIGVGWAVIIYSARLFTDSLGLTLWACAALDTLLALNIDLSMDTVAYRLHMWHWDWTGTHLNPLTANWFGIPWGNFFGWTMVIFFYSAFSRLFENWILRANPPLFRFILVAILALLCSQILLYVMENYIEAVFRKLLGLRSVHWFLGSVGALIIVAATAWRKRLTPTNRVPVVAWLVPAWFHLLFFACLFIFGFYTENVWMTFAACVNLLTGILMHIAPIFFEVNAKGI